MIVKVCGVRRLGDLRAMAGLGVDWVGFVYGFEGTPRNLSLHEVTELVNSTPEGVEPVVVTRSETQLIEELLSRCTPFALQLYGDLTCLVKGVKVILPIKLEGQMQTDVFRPEFAHADYFLLESSRPGTGTRLDWSLARSFREHLRSRPVLLSGGLNAENVCQAIATVKPDGVDVSSGVESSPGEKDLRKVKTFVEKVRACAPAR